MDDVLLKWMALGVVLAIVIGTLLSIATRAILGVPSTLAVVLGAFVGVCLGLGIAARVLGVRRHLRSR